MEPFSASSRGTHNFCFLIPLAALAAMVIGNPPAARAANAPASVSATGHATLKKRPDILRASIMIQSHGKDMAEAVSKLQPLRDQTKAKLVASGAVEASIQFADPVEGAGGTLTPQQRQMQMFQEMQQRGNRKPPPPQGTTISCTVTAEWPFAAASGDEALVNASALEQKIRTLIPAAGSAGEKKTLTPEEQELAEEAAAQQPNGGDAGPKPGEPSFLFVYKLAPADKAKLRGEAFASAKTQAADLAAASGKTLGAVHEISGGVAGAAPPDNPYAAYLAAMNGGDSAAQQPDDNSEATGAEPNSVNYTLNVSAKFGLE